MDDYEKINAQEWDLNYRGPANTNNTPAASLSTAKPQANLKQKQVPPSKKPATPNHAISKPSQPRARHAATNGTRGRRPALSTKSAWTIAEGVRTREQPHQEPQALNDVVDNAGEAAWRQHQLPVRIIMVPEELVWRDQQHESIAKKFGTYVALEDRVRSTGEIKFGIWGEADAVKHTFQAIHNWVSREAPSKHALGLNQFSKTRSLLPQQRHAEEKKWSQEVTRQRFRQFPPPRTVFGAIGTFHWPVKEYQPHELLGNSYEAFDPIRMDCSCYVVFEPDISAFQVMGETSAVKTALLRIRKACFQIAAHQIAPVRRYILHFGDTGGDVSSHVALASYDRVKRIGATASVIEQPPGCCPYSQGEVESEEDKQQLLDSSTQNIKIAGKTIMLMINKLHYYRGHLRFRIRLGAFLATNYRATDDGTYTTEDFTDMIQQSQFAGEITPEYFAPNITR